jgi:hypothetical protein
MCGWIEEPSILADNTPITVRYQNGRFDLRGEIELLRYILQFQVAKPSKMSVCIRGTSRWKGLLQQKAGKRESSMIVD